LFGTKHTKHLRLLCAVDVSNERLPSRRTDSQRSRRHSVEKERAAQGSAELLDNVTWVIYRRSKRTLPGTRLIIRITNIYLLARLQNYSPSAEARFLRNLPEFLRRATVSLPCNNHVRAKLYGNEINNAKRNWDVVASRLKQATSFQNVSNKDSM
jgi:hypothetical protein